MTMVSPATSSNSNGTPFRRSSRPSILFLFCFTLVQLLPVTLGNWGLSEGVFGILYHYAGAQGETGVLIALLMRVMTLPAALAGWILFLARKRDPREPEPAERARSA